MILSWRAGSCGCSVCHPTAHIAAGGQGSPHRVLRSAQAEIPFLLLDAGVPLLPLAL